MPIEMFVRAQRYLWLLREATYFGCVTLVLPFFLSGVSEGEFS